MRRCTARIRSVSRHKTETHKRWARWSIALASRRTFGALFTAASMISFVALVGIIVRNSTLLVDFIRHGTGDGEDTT